MPRGRPTEARQIGDLEIAKFFQLRIELHPADPGALVVCRQHAGIQHARSSHTRQLHVGFGQKRPHAVTTHAAALSRAIHRMTVT